MSFFVLMLEAKGATVYAAKSDVSSTIPRLAGHR